jgi:hypothetical protein
MGRAGKEAAMDVTPLIVPVMTALSTFLAGVADGAAHKVGEAAVEQSKRIYEAVKARFHKEADGGLASQVLTLFEQNQKLRPAVEAELERILRADPAFAATLHQLVQDGPLQQVLIKGTGRDISQENSAGKGKQIIAIDGEGEGIQQKIS